MKKIIYAICCVLAFSNVSFAECNIAVVDLQKVVNQSSQVRLLKQEHIAKINELNGILTKAQSEIAKENDIKKIVEIQDRYSNEFNRKKTDIDKVYADKISAIENKIISDVESVAKTKGYDMVFAKSVALYGGHDITPDVSKMIK